jgi:hypothetical protein
VVSAQPHAPFRPNPTGPTIEEPNVARFMVIPGSDAGFLIPSDENPLGDRHIQGLDAPGLAPGMPAVLFFRTQYTQGTRFSVRLNSSVEFQFLADESAAKSWHELIAPGVLRERDNELTLALRSDGQVIFSEIAILYTSNKLTVTRPLVLEPTPG